MVGIFSVLVIGGVDTFLLWIVAEEFGLTPLKFTGAIRDATLGLEREATPAELSEFRRLLRQIDRRQLDRLIRVLSLSAVFVVSAGFVLIAASLA